MNPESKEFISAAAASRSQGDFSASLSRPISSTQNKDPSTDVNKTLLPIPTITVTPFVNQLPSNSELLGNHLKNPQHPKTKSTVRPGKSTTLFTPAMSDSNASSPGARQVGGVNGVNGVTGSPANLSLFESEDYSPNGSFQGGIMSLAYSQGQPNHHNNLASFTQQQGESMSTTYNQGEPYHHNNLASQGGPMSATYIQGEPNHHNNLASFNHQQGGSMSAAYNLGQPNHHNNLESFIQHQGGAMSTAYAQGQASQQNLLTFIVQPQEEPMSQGQATQLNQLASFAQQFTQESFPEPNQQPPTSEAIRKSNLFCAIAARAYQEAVKLPENPPPLDWIPGQPLTLYYEELFMRFQILFRQILECQGRYEESTFHDEWLLQCRNIMENLVMEWDLHPFGSVGGVKTTLPTRNAVAARMALHAAVEKPNVPPPSGWRSGDELHPYYESMLAKFERHLGLLLGERRRPVYNDLGQVQQATREYSEFIIREYRNTWTQMFPQ
ncbi:hypothetical protein FQN54_000644 [Arachnomyces sp. PD_36]|nr:hypothetical protein FQN54_000644 [Arachnomyces sp. PD_36]